ncbi:MAG TPA: alpha/beta fold hydrolase [Rhodanobacter sp.]|nr:alpha/beta fold hydrolase [Rhodanobacter sp.]
MKTLLCSFALFFSAGVFAATAQDSFSMAQVTNVPYPSGLVAAKHGNRIAWVLDKQGVRNIWMAEGPAFTPRQMTSYTEDDGQELSQLTFSPDGSYLVYVRGGDHDANWPAKGNLAPDPSSTPVEPNVAIWSIALDSGKLVKVADGDEPAVSSTHRLAFISKHQIWSAALDGKGKPEQLVFDRGEDGSPRWSPDGSRLAFVSARDDHAFIGVFRGKDQPIVYLAPNTSLDGSPHWSPDGTRIAFARQPGRGGAPQPFLQLTPRPWSIWVADAATGAGQVVWRSPERLNGSYPDTEGTDNLHWAAGDRLVFLGDMDGWPHLYSVPASGGEALLLTPGKFMAEFVSLSPDRRYLVYNANTGSTPGDDDRRHLYRVPVDAARPQALTSGATIEWLPVVTGDGKHLAFLQSGARRPPLVVVASTHGGDAHALNADQIPRDFPTDQLVVPQPVTFKAADGWTIHGQLFQGKHGTARRPAIIFVHGGPPRQMFLGWHNWSYYGNAYAVNQYLANHGFVVLSVNYRLGIGYGHAFHYPEHAGPSGASEYQDVVAGAKYLQGLKTVDPTRIGIWGGSYGGYLTALALARNSDIFKAGVDLHGVHDWSALFDDFNGKAKARYQQGDRKQAMKVAWESSPDAEIAKWTSPVLVVQGDDDRNVPFDQMVDLVQRLDKQKVPYQQLVIPNEIHDFLRHASWLRVDEATAHFFTEQLNPAQ